MKAKPQEKNKKSAEHLTQRHWHEMNRKQRRETMRKMESQFQALCSSSPKHNDLVTQSQVLELEGGTRSEDRRQSREECQKSSEHRRNYERCNSHPFRSFEVFERHSCPLVNTTSSCGSNAMW